MTDLKGVVVAFDRDIREDEAGTLLAAIRQLRGVADVQPSIANLNDEIVRMRVDMEWRQRIYDMLDKSSRADT
jgi:hypothetical protein